MPRLACALRATGYTLVELAVTVAVLAILAVSAVPAFSDFLETSRLRAAGDAVVALIGQARGVAVKNARGVSVRGAGEGGAWCVGAREALSPADALPVAHAAPCDCVADGDACIVDTQRAAVSGAMHPGVALLSSGGELHLAGGTGARESEAAPVRLASRSGRHAVTISVSPLGVPAMCSTGAPMLGVQTC